MTLAAPKLSTTVAAYFALEASSREKHEYWHGEVYAMAGASPEHNLIAANVTAALHTALRALPCRVYASDLKVHVPLSDGYVYPDVTVGCDGPRYHSAHPDVLLNPRLVVEVLSESTERFDRGEKSAGYRTLDSVTDYLLISQRDRHVEHYARQRDGSWSLRDFHAGDVIEIASLAISVQVDEVYFKVFESGTAAG